MPISSTFQGCQLPGGLAALSLRHSNVRTNTSWCVRLASSVCGETGTPKHKYILPQQSNAKVQVALYVLHRLCNYGKGGSCTALASSGPYKTLTLHRQMHHCQPLRLSCDAKLCKNKHQEERPKEKGADKSAYFITSPAVAGRLLRLLLGRSTMAGSGQAQNRIHVHIFKYFMSSASIASHLPCSRQSYRHSSCPDTQIKPMHSTSRMCTKIVA
jgi:hypothetical protein